LGFYSFLWDMTLAGYAFFQRHFEIIAHDLGKNRGPKQKKGSTNQVLPFMRSDEILVAGASCRAAA
jgi:hypothetical protein